jgi:hypothetical protein
MNLTASIQQIESGMQPAHVAQAVEHFLGKEKVPGSNPGVGSNRSRDATAGGRVIGVRLIAAGAGVCAFGRRVIAAGAGTYGFGAVDLFIFSTVGVACSGLASAR